MARVTSCECERSFSKTTYIRQTIRNERRCSQTAGRNSCFDRLGRCLKLIVSSESISCHEFASQFGLEFVLYAKKNPNISLIQSRPHVVYFNGSPTGHCLASVESGAPNHDGLIGRTDTANSDGLGGGGVCVFASVSVCARAYMRACVRDVFAIYDNDILPRLIMIIIKISILYFIKIRHTDDFS